ncbi:hypothetical protein FHW83_001431 [Duganella sp. SG902]|uniref:hypothetical protein n=1 Tax=Duganella sp. SG902 TaxID=2587016 RepID=UPI00159DFD7E|nr:hypothetical protein [Duganella sp. SG902]NVM75644.1 hypothetical protein [Duganella sp. SG902]
MTRLHAGRNQAKVNKTCRDIGILDDHFALAADGSNSLRPGSNGKSKDNVGIGGLRKLEGGRARNVMSGREFYTQGNCRVVCGNWPKELARYIAPVAFDGPPDG